MKKTLMSVALALTALGALAQAKYVFYFIGDGMGMGHVNAAETYLRDVVKADESLLMLQFPVASQARTFSANKPITDSAAAGTALSTGSKTNNYSVGVDPAGVDLQSIARDFMADGRSVAVLTSVAADDATPAAFYAHAAQRGESGKISGYAPQSGLAFLGGPMVRGMYDKQKQPTDWVERMLKAGYTLVNTQDELLRLPEIPEKVLMLAEKPFGEQLGYTLDSIPGALTLAEITESALRVVQNDPEGFFMMCEGGNIDWAAHANDGAAVIKEVLNFQEAIDVAYRFYLEHPQQTLIVVTADHDTGGMALGRQDNNKDIRLDLIDFQKISKDRFAEWCRDEFTDRVPTWEQMRSFIAENLGLWGAIVPTEAEEQTIRRSFDETFVTRNAENQQTLYNSFNNFTYTLYDIINRHYGLGFTTTSHTGNFVPVYALGEGSQLFTRNLNNIEIPMLLLKAAGLRR